VQKQPPNERPRIINTYHQLLDSFPSDRSVLDAAPLHADTWGVPDGKPIRNLSALLAKSWPQVRDFWRKNLADQQATTDALARHRHAQALDDSNELAQNQRIEESFITRHPDPADQATILKRYASPTLDINTRIGRFAALSRWWEKTRSSSSSSD
jgi:hypothetical protein